MRRPPPHLLHDRVRALASRARRRAPRAARRGRELRRGAAGRAAAAAVGLRVYERLERRESALGPGLLHQRLEPRVVRDLPRAACEFREAASA